MRLLIDGHNLIPKIPGLSLRDIDDEQRLLEMLSAYARETRDTIEVFFDKAPPTQARKRTFGRVQAHFVAAHTIADTAIIKRLHALGKSARNWVVVSSDHVVQQNARGCGARVLPSEDFARRLRPPLASNTLPEKPDQPPDEDEVDYWLRVFQKGDGGDAL